MSDEVDTRSPETAYATKSNIAFPGTATQATEAAARAAQREADGFPTSADGKRVPTTVTRASAVNTKTNNVRR